MRGRADRIPATDALVTTEVGLVLTTLHADCAPVYFAVAAPRVIALAHCGWRSTLGGLAGMVLQKLVHEFGAEAGQVQVAFGPMIASAVYEIGPDVAAQFDQRFGARTVERRAGRPYLDLAAALTVDLLEHGLAPTQIPARPPCTYSDRRYASYRRDGLPTRSMLAWLVREA